MIRFIRSGQSGELLRIRFPVKIAAVHDAAAHAGCMAVHVLCGRMGHDIGAPLKRTAVDRSCKRIVNNQRHAVSVCCPRKLFNIQNHQGRIGDSLTKYRLRIRLKCLLQLFLCRIRIHQSRINSQFLKCHGKEIGRSAIDCRRTDHVISFPADI